MLLFAVPCQAQDSASNLYLAGSLGWLHPTQTLASPNPEFAIDARRGALAAAPVLGVGLGVRLPAPLPQLRLSVQRLVGSELEVQDSDGAESLGDASLTTALLELVISPFRVGPVSPHLTLGAGIMRYGFPQIEDAELARLFEDGATSTAVSAGIGAVVSAGRFDLSLDAADVISTFNSPAVESERRPGESIDIDETQHDLRFTFGIRYDLGGR